MLKITAAVNDVETKLVLEGKLVDPFIAELERAWAEAHAKGKPQRVTIDLKDVTTISERGQALLGTMMNEGAKFNCCRGVLTKHLVERLIERVGLHRRKKDETK